MDSTDHGAAAAAFKNMLEHRIFVMLQFPCVVAQMLTADGDTIAEHTEVVSDHRNSSSAAVCAINAVLSKGKTE